MGEVMRSKHTRLASRLVLLAMADAADDDFRMCWLSVPTIASKANIKERQTYNVLRDLEERHIIAAVPDEERPPESLRYKSAVRRILPVEEWIPEPEKGARTTPANNAGVSEGSCDITTPKDPANFAPCTGVHPTPNYLTSTTREIEETTSLPPRQSARSDLYDAEETPRPGAKGWNAVRPLRGPGGKRKSRKQEALEQEQAERELDPAYVVSQAIGDSDPGESLAARLPASDDDLAPPVRRTPKKRSKRPSEELAEFFDHRAGEVGHPVPGSTNLGALTGTFGRWMAQGLGREEVRQMIITYWSTSWQRSDNVVAWKDFLAARGLLTQRLGKADKVDEVENNRFNEDYWS
jgi:hypothetical protein